MSGPLVGLTLCGVHGVSLRAKSVLLALVETCQTANSPAFPGTPRIASYFDIGHRQVRQALAELEALGWTRRIPGTGHGPGNPAKYLIDFAAMREPAQEFERTRGEVCIAAKAAHAGRINAAHVGRNWSDQKRRILRSK